MGNSSSSSKAAQNAVDFEGMPGGGPPSPLNRISSRVSLNRHLPTRRSAQDDISVAATSLAVPPAQHRRTRSVDPDSLEPPPPYSRTAPSSHTQRRTERPVTSPASNNSTSSRSPRSPTHHTGRLGSGHTRVFNSLPPLPLENEPSGSRTTSDAGRTRSRRPVRSNTYLRAPMRRESAENALETLRKFDTVIIVDDSRSMAGPLWKEARDALAALAQTAGDYDTDGIDVHFLNDQRVGRGLKNADLVNRLFSSVRPNGISLIGEKLEELLLQYLSMIEVAKDSGDPLTLKAIKPVNFIVITDGVPTDDPEDVIVNAARRLDARSFPLTQLGIQFVQIGKSAKATEFLEELDNDLASTHGIRDIVDTTPYVGGELTSELLTKILLGGINRRVDRRGAEAVM